MRPKKMYCRPYGTDRKTIYLTVSLRAREESAKRAETFRFISGNESKNDIAFKKKIKRECSKNARPS